MSVAHSNPDTLPVCLYVELCIPSQFDLLSLRSLHFEALKEFKDLVEVKGSASGKWTGWRNWCELGLAAQLCRVKDIAAKNIAAYEVEQRNTP